MQYCDNPRHKHKAEQAGEHADEEGEEVGVEECTPHSHHLLLRQTWLLLLVQTELASQSVGCCQWKIAFGSLITFLTNLREMRYHPDIKSEDLYEV